MIKKINNLLFNGLILVTAVFVMVGLQTNAQKLEADVVVYGDASGGVVAAVQASKMGKTAILISPVGHLGGLTTSGLGWSDIGNDKILGGLSREFYHALYQYYQKPESWKFQTKKSFRNRGQGIPALNPKTELASTFEPGAAEYVFDKMVHDAGVKVIKGRLDLRNGVKKEGNSIEALILESGEEIKGKVFIDASYEGDLLPGAGVSFVIGREANSEFNEQGNGNRGKSKKNQLPNGIDPYVVKGDPNSGLILGVNQTAGGKVGDADHRLQAYCYRMVLTNVPENSVSIKKPPTYNEAEYEILFRMLEKPHKGRFFKTDLMQNFKTDSNNMGGFSCDYIGGNYGDDWNWATLSHDEREKLADRHRDYQKGLVWTLQNHPRVPEKVRKNYKQWGLAKDEFVDNGHWPYCLYVREARRMRSDFVMTEAHCKNEKPVEDSVGMGAYALDSHNTQRFVYNGMVKNEGDIQTKLKGHKPYGISYRSIVPKEAECDNLLVPWALSATHIAFGSIRMEPVFMVLSQSAATAACISIDNKQGVQKLDYSELRAKLLEDGQRLGE